MFFGPFWNWVQGTYSEINQIKSSQHFYNNEDIDKLKPLSQEHVKNFSTCVIHNFSCIYTTNVEGPTIPDNVNSDCDKVSSNCAADYYETLHLQSLFCTIVGRYVMLYINLKYMCNYIGTPCNEHNIFSCGATQYTTLCVCLCVCVCVLRFCYDPSV